jgi:hypothetical protein
MDGLSFGKGNCHPRIVDLYMGKNSLMAKTDEKLISKSRENFRGHAG